VQTLDDDIRRVIGRLEPGQAVLLKVASALQTGFILSVDVIYGLPGQMVGGLLNTLSKLIEIGVHGFSLYQLQEGPLNRRFMKESGALHRDPLLDYAMFAAAEKYLLKRGFEKNHFAHFARKEDGNLYYRHAVRGEDLLAFGPVSDGVFGDYRYRHVGFRDYMNSRTRNHPRLEGGVCETSEELHLRRVISHLMAGSISFELLQHAGAENMLPVWLGQRMLEPAELLGWYSLTANGSWFLTRMIGELEAAQRSLS
jgi:oxygen-independent coproporphyrinogen-3 oxidase